MTKGLIVTGEKFELTQNIYISVSRITLFVCVAFPTTKTLNLAWITYDKKEYLTYDKRRAKLKRYVQKVIMS